MAQFADMLRFLRKRTGLTQAELAQKTGISRSRINNYENGLREPDFETAEAFADFFNVNMDTLMGRVEIKNPVTENDDGNQDRIADLMLSLSQLSDEDFEYLVGTVKDLLQKKSTPGDQ